jgi:outer membrane receptor protein involved in Fe transport
MVLNSTRLHPYFITLIFCFFVSYGSQAGRFYGKIIDATTGKGISSASVQVWQDGYDEVRHEAKPILKAGQLTEANGDFNLDNVPNYGFMILKVTALGYDPLEKKVSFEVIIDKKTGPEINLGTYDKDLGDLKLTAKSVELGSVQIKADEPFMKTKVDRKIYNADKLTGAAGGTATDVLKNVPGVNVDLDGKVTMRNKSPQVYVDGKPTNLSIDQIPASSIQSVEVISNPSSKYDASGGGGIVNLVLKKERRMGYNGNVSLGVDRRGRINANTDFNFRQKKMNFFVGASLFQRKSISEGNTNRQNLTFPQLYIDQGTRNVSKNLFTNAYIGFDWFINVRNTLTISQAFTSGGFGNNDALNIKYDSQLIAPSAGFSNANRTAAGNRTFNNLGTSIQYKRLFPKNGRELTSDIFYNTASSVFYNNTQTTFTNEQGQVYRNNAQQKQQGDGNVGFLIGQIDYSEDITSKRKIDFGVRTQVSTFSSDNTNSIYNHITNKFDTLKSQQNSYSYTDQVSGVYVDYSHEYKKFSYQAGLRAENYLYKGSLKESGQTFGNNYPISLFPTLFATYKIDDDRDIQFNASRRVERPNFFQLIPYLDFSDSLNLSRGNPALKPEFSYQGELAYNYLWEHKKSFTATGYYRYATNLITRVQTSEWSEELKKNMIISSYANANVATAFGLEMNYQNIYKKKLEYNINVNIYRSQINVDQAKLQSTNLSQFSSFSKANIVYKYSKNTYFQMQVDFQTRVSLQPDGSGGGPFNFGGDASSSSQGYQRPTGGIDLAWRWDFNIKKETAEEKKKKDPSKAKPARLVISFSDLLHTRRYDQYQASPFYVQNTFRQRDWQMVRVVFSYKFGKFDVFLFRRKSSNRNSGVQL